ncbi:syntaxin-17-like isoform X2 [Ctenocephalides felis]|uniref:syntaxin-17-like isoform X2 n=1 Tax=Ctenocephalides felis TaxID=7515 RepID=UPI000E6E51DC|nr:syntaxin-17-like isoform X2 [Ctenocephalides felis]
MEDLQNEVQEIQELFTELNSVVHRQGEHVNVVENNIENAQENINQGARHLALAAKFKPAFYPLAGAVIGTCVGGPIGLIAGFKVGGAAAMGCGVLGFTGGQILKKRKHTIMQDVDKKQQ